MVVSIPSPTPITGIKTQGGKPSLRRPLADFQKDQPIAFSLYVQALANWQAAGGEEIDDKNVIGTSYFQITGVHGVPAIPWQDDPTPPAEEKPVVGYCTHRSVLFIPWHRPYLMLFEQIIHAYAEDIVNNAQGHVKEAYAAALAEVRLPYWDWAHDPSIPKALMTPDITLSIPGEDGSTQSLHLDHNPLFSYKFTSDYATGIISDCMGWDKAAKWNESKRCPDETGQSHNEIADMQISTFFYMKDSTFQHLLKAKDFDEFTTQAYRDGQGLPSYTSVEAMHNNIHNYVGTNDSVINDDTTKLQGSMTEVQASSFDPIFWLHHVNCDRLAALWQALNTNVEIKAFPSMLARYTAKTANMEDGNSRLEPWHKAADHSDKSYYIANDMKELISTFDSGYYYPETPLDFIQDPAQMKAYTTKQIWNLYAPSYLPPPTTPAGPDTPAKDQPKDQPTEAIPSLPKPGPISSETWEVFLRVRNFALSGTWGVHVFLGSVPSESKDWFKSENRVGSITMLSTLAKEHCSNCSSQAQNDQLVTGTVALTEALIKRGIDVNSTDDVVKYLKDNLNWRVAKDTKEVPITDSLKLIIGVYSQRLTMPDSHEKLPDFEKSKAHPEATAGKPGGFDGSHLETLQIQT